MMEWTYTPKKNQREPIVRKKERKKDLQTMLYWRRLKKWNAREPKRWRILAHWRWRMEEPKLKERREKRI